MIKLHAAKQRHESRLLTQGRPAAVVLHVHQSRVAHGIGLHIPFFGDLDLPMNWGQPWDLTVGLLAFSSHTSDASFFSTARLTDIQLFDAAHQRITDFTLSAASGTDYLAATVPEPPAWSLWALGLIAVVLQRRQAVSKA